MEHVQETRIIKTNYWFLKPSGYKDTKYVRIQTEGNNLITWSVGYKLDNREVIVIYSYGPISDDMCEQLEMEFQYELNKNVEPFIKK